MTPSFFIFGMGYAASTLARTLIKQGLHVVGTSRTPQKMRVLEAIGVKVIHFFDPNIAYYLSQASHVLISIPPESHWGDLVLHHYKPLIERARASIQWLGYFSSTGVYGDHQGQWVDEESSCRPQGASGLLRLNTEKDWRHFADEHGLPLHIYRLSGIYGPGRNVLERIIAGKKYSLCKKDHVFSRVHVDDIVATIIASINNTSLFSIYNVADDEPCSSHLVDAYAAALLGHPGLPTLQIDEVSLSTMEKEFYSANKRVANTKIKQELRVNLKYPSYREGLNAIWKSDLKKDYK